MIYSQQLFGYGNTYGAIYFAGSVGLAQKHITDSEIGGTTLSDIRNGTNCLQYNTNGGKMPAFDWVEPHFDTHFHIAGRIGRIVPMMVDLKKSLGFGLD
jgi:hypothetical protein